MPSKKKPTSKPTAWDEEPTPVPGEANKYIDPIELTEPHGFTVDPRDWTAPTPAMVGWSDAEQVAAAQRLAAKVAKALKRPRVSVGEQVVLAHMALLAIAAGPKSLSRDIAVTALKVVG